MDVNLVLLKKNGSQKIFALPSSITVMGRRSDCDLYIPLKPVSRRHCQLNRDRGVLKIRDLGSRNGTYVNGKRLEEEAAVVQPGDEIKVGPLTFVLQIDGRPEQIKMPKAAREESLEDRASADDATVEDSDSALDLDFDSSDLDLDSAELGLDSLEGDGPD
ncbi:MAG: FHA domain-containing protein [Planctomycetota bacterium]|jgi:pSer/pThr/pTyr-binding forkhead associated (FHA) protein